jgi:hypothetical protein
MYPATGVGCHGRPSSDATVTSVSGIGHNSVAALQAGYHNPYPGQQGPPPGYPQGR